jgi:hypothetical protein
VWRIPSGGVVVATHPHRTLWTEARWLLRVAS